MPIKRSAEDSSMERVEVQGESTGKRQRTFKEDHSMDSDDENPEGEGSSKQQYAVMNEDDIEGQEDGQMKVDEGVRITPFNLQEELEEGNFDADGMYHLNKEKVVRDAWLDNLDDYTDGDYEKFMKKKSDEAAAIAASAAAVQSDEELYKIVLGIIRPGESIMKALKRLGSGIKPVVKSKRSVKKEVDVVRERDPVKETFDKLTSAADTLLQKGNLEIYQETYEKIAYKVAKAEEKMASLEVEEELDMFGEAFDAGKKGEDGSGVTVGRAPLATAESDEESEPQVAWEYKWENSDAANIHGPYSSEQMNEWVQQDFFKNGVFVRKFGIIDAPFYSSKRVDFELYM